MTSPSIFTPDALSSALELVRCRGAGLRVLHPPRDFGVAIPAGAPTIHIVDAGALGLALTDAAAPQAEHALRRGDVAILPHGDACRVWAGAATPAPLQSFAVAPRDIDKSAQAPPAPICWVLGELAFEQLMGRRLLDVLPRVIVARATGPRRPWIDAALAALVEEARGGAPGAAAVASRALELLVVEAVRGWARETPRPTWLAGATDPRVGKALAAIHAEPARPWSVPDLARLAALSRSAFAERFRRLVGETPFDYLLGLRLDRAAAALRETDDPVGALARRCGFDSPAAFSRAFKARFAVTPTQWRATRPPPPV